MHLFFFLFKIHENKRFFFLKKKSCHLCSPCSKKSAVSFPFVIIITIYNIMQIQKIKHKSSRDFVVATQRPRHSSVGRWRFWLALIALCNPPHQVQSVRRWWESEQWVPEQWGVAACCNGVSQWAVLCLSVGDIASWKSAHRAQALWSWTSREFFFFFSVLQHRRKWVNPPLKVFAVPSASSLPHSESKATGADWEQFSWLHVLVFTGPCLCLTPAEFVNEGL